MSFSLMKRDYQGRVDNRCPSGLDAYTLDRWVGAGLYARLQPAVAKAKGLARRAVVGVGQDDSGREPKS